jgi:hypothetical protein
MAGVLELCQLLALKHLTSSKSRAGNTRICDSSVSFFNCSAHCEGGG